ncbi:MAG: hypothetical protein LVT47_02460 [Cyanobacteria bacterium LVE1205-1]|jgi:hypothetical protein
MNERTIPISLGSPEPVRIGIGWGLRPPIGQRLYHTVSIFTFLLPPCFELDFYFNINHKPDGF